LLVTVNNRLILEIEIVHDLSCHPIILRPKTQKWDFQCEHAWLSVSRNISAIMRDRVVSKENKESIHCECNGHVTHDVIYCPRGQPNIFEAR